MRIWVDADACPVKDEIDRLAAKRGIRVTHVCALTDMRRDGAEVVRVAEGPDAADEWILAQLAPGDLVITQDIPLAAESIRRGAIALEFRGRELTPDNIPDRLTARNVATTLRDAGAETRGPRPLTPNDRRNFTNALARILDRAKTR